MLLKNARARAKKLGIPFDLTEADLEIPENCPVLGLKLQINRKTDGLAHYTSPSLDRLIPGLGYVKGNVAVISNRANGIKREGTAREHELIAQWMRSQGAE